MKKELRSALAAFCLGLFAAVSTLLTPDLAHAQVNSSSDSKYAAIVIDAYTGEVLYAKRADSPRYPASITKVMTLYLAFEALSQGRMTLEDRITISRHAASMQPTKLGLAAGKTISVEDAIQAIAIKSANDIATAMAEHLGGTESQFGALMTLKAHELGMTGSRFVNASGLPDSRQISTARDLAILSRSIMRDFPQYYAYFGQKQFVWNGQAMNNHNNLLRQMPGVDGIKTGFTNASGYNLAASATEGDTRLIAVVLGGTSNAQRDSQMRSLLQTGFEVMRRRSQGELLAETQNLFEPREYARVPQSDTAQMVQVADTDFPTAEQGSMAPIPDAQPSQVASGPRGDYIVQVGAFRRRDDAQSQLRDVGRRFNDIFASVEADLGSAVGGFFRARFRGFTAEGAREACARLQASRVTCMVIAP